ncbi:hypothetical protein THAOC_28401 [Thalassiosira oceanica]|uniref:Uncharacterized protein n=1 Tax=Thalassiosira oceanica TaxID=159749 RepID=K0RF49_THAOC|nr:hypothetical protein THAOC_28401 [Thalassiosira oceanica]|eukprot:EJK52338.1 hypothetical protein THAOC_28401 [Thalassiosira oceanica]
MDAAAAAPSAMESARLRLAAAERWHASSVAMLQQAKAQADLSGKEAEAARAALHELELRSACPPTGSDSSAPNQAAHIGDVDATALSSGKDDGLLHGGVGQNPSGQEVYNVPAVVSAPDEGDRKPAVVVTASVGEADDRKPAAVVTPGDERRDDDEARKPKAVSPTASVVSDSHSVYVSARSNINSITISDSSIEEVNGKYVKLEKLDGVWSYSKIANWGGKETMFTVLRTNASGSGSRKWYITVNDRGVETAFYVALAPNFVLHPPQVAARGGALAPGHRARGRTGEEGVEEGARGVGLGEPEGTGPEEHHRERADEAVGVEAQVEEPERLDHEAEPVDEESERFQESVRDTDSGTRGLTVFQSL